MSERGTQSEEPVGAKTNSPPVNHGGLNPPRRRWLTVLLSLLIFAAGFVAGGGTAVITVLRTVRQNIHHPERAPARVTARLRHRLDLSDEQTRKVQAIVERRQEALMEIRRQVQPRVMAELAQARDEIAQVLDAEQKAKWVKLYEDLHRAWMPPLPPASAEGGGATTKPATTAPK